MEETGWKELFIIHNHGIYHLKDVVVINEYPYTDYAGGKPRFISWKIRGTVIKGYSTSRLFHATSTKELEVGSDFEIDIYGKRPFWNEFQKRWELSLVSCG